MLAFPLAYVLIPFAFMYFVVGLFFFFNIFHIKRYAIQSPSTTMLLLTYVGTFLILTFVAGGYLLSVNWQKTFQPQDLLPSFNSSTRL